jgi:hypothetical protein
VFADWSRRYRLPDWGWPGPDSPYEGPSERDLIAIKLLVMDGRTSTRDELLMAGQGLAASLVDQDLPPLDTSVIQVFGPGETPTRDMTNLARLWTDLIYLARYQKRGRYSVPDQIRGVVTRLESRLADEGEAWAVSVPGILDRLERLGEEGKDLLLLTAAKHDDVRTALKVASHQSRSDQRDLALGLLTRLDGLPLPGEDIAMWLADHAARAFDGAPLFPRALTPLARTWIGDAAVEDTVTRSLQGAERQIAQTVQAQGAAQEEHLTGNDRYGADRSLPAGITTANCGWVCHHTVVCSSRTTPHTEV